MVEVVIFSVAAVLLAGAGWGLVCNNRTFDDRTKIADMAVFGRPDWRERLNDYERVTYDAHLKARFLLRSPWGLYSARIREGIGQ